MIFLTRARCFARHFGVFGLLLLAACASDSGPAKPKKADATVQASSPQTAQETLAPISAEPPGGEQRPLLPGQTDTQYTPDGLPALTPTSSVSADQLFSEKLSDEKARIDRLERAVTDLRREFDAVKPAIIRLSAVEGDMQDLLGQLQTLTNGNTSPDAMAAQPTDGGDGVDPVSTDDAPAAPVASVQANKPAIETPKATPASIGTGVTDIRSGEHGDASRIVLDLSEKVAYTKNLDNDDHVLMIELDGADWNAAETGKFAKSPLLQSWSTTAGKDGKGSVVAIQLSGPATITAESMLPGRDGSGARLMIDLKSQ